MFNILSQNRFVILSALVLFSALSLGFILPNQSVAQETTKPKLVEVILNDSNSDKEAVKVIEKIYNDWIKENRTKDILGKVNARFIPIAEDGRNDKFIFGILYGEDFGGCYNRGCRTVIFHSKGNNEWVGVFNAFVARTFYDENSERSIKNLVVSSNLNASNPGVWMWNGIGFQIVNAQ